MALPFSPVKPDSGSSPPCRSISDIVELTGFSRSTIERLRSSGKLPRPDLVVCRSPRWKASTIADWIDSGGAVAPLPKGGRR